MSRVRYTFAEFRKDFIDDDSDWSPVWVGLGEDNQGKPIERIIIDYIYRWRLADGKVLLVSVDFKNEHEKQHILQSASRDVRRLAAEVEEQISWL
jgi:hypothetical protein